MTFRSDGARVQLSSTLTSLARIYPLVDAGQYQSAGSASGTTAKVQTSGHGDVSSQWRPAATAAVVALRDFGNYLGKLLVRSGAASDWTPDPVLALLIAARPRLARALIEYGHDTDVAFEARELLGQARSALQSDYLRRMPLAATCLGSVLYDGDNGEELERVCGAPLQAVFRHSRAAIYCADHPGAHKVESDMWPALIGDLLARRP